MSVYGCVTRTVLDTALFLDVVTAGGGDPGARRRPRPPFAEAAGTARQARIAFSTGRRGARAAERLDEVRPRLAAIELLRSLGHDVAGTTRVRRVGKGFSVALSRRDPDEAYRPHPSASSRARAASAGSAGLRAGRAARDREASDRQSMLARSNREFDVYVTPTTGVPPVEVGSGTGRARCGRARDEPRLRVHAVWNITGQPAASVPAGFTDDGLPLSVSSSGGPKTRRACSRSPRRSRPTRPWADRRPPVS